MNEENFKRIRDGIHIGPKHIYKDLKEVFDYIDMYNPYKIYVGKRNEEKIPNSILDIKYDPEVSNEEINPILEDGLKLSSGAVRLEGEQNVLLIPKHNYET